MFCNAFLLTVLLSAHASNQARNETPSCIVLAGGFTGEELSPAEAVVEFRKRVWAAYKEQSSACIELRTTTKEGAVATTVFYSGNSQGTWGSKIKIEFRGLRNTGESRPAQAIQKISRIELSTNRTLEDEVQAEPKSYGLVFHLSDGGIVDQ